MASWARAAAARRNPPCRWAPAPIWLKAYAAVTKAGRYVQGGGCCTVGVAGLIQSGGFGSFSKNFGLAAASLLEAEVVTADGQVRIANACTNPDLFWALKGGGGGSLGVVTRLTLKTHPLPNFLGGAFGNIEASTPEAYKRLIAQFMALLSRQALQPALGRVGALPPRQRARHRNGVPGSRSEHRAGRLEAVHRLGGGVAERLCMDDAVAGVAAPAHFFWDAAFLKANIPQAVRSDDRPGAPPMRSTGRAMSARRAGSCTTTNRHGCRRRCSTTARARKSGRCPVRGLAQWSIQLHFNKGLAGAPPEAARGHRGRARHRDEPAVLDAFALAIISASSAPSLPGIAGHEPNLARAGSRQRRSAPACQRGAQGAPDSGAYVSESSYFQKDWQIAYWGGNYGRLRAVKQKYDPDGLFFVHNGVGSDEWSRDGFARL
jgi:hypothetical protein